MLELAQLFMSAAGFGLPFGILLLMSGRVKVRNELDTLTRVISAFCLSLACFWLIGYSLFNGPSYAGLIGLGWNAVEQSMMINSADDIRNLFLFSIPPILVTTSMAERGSFMGGNLLVVVVALLVVPVTAHWAWADSAGVQGWLAARGFTDEGGAVVIFASAGFVALASSAAIGPRVGRYPLQPERPRGHSPTFHAFGVIIIIFSLALVGAGEISSISEMPGTVFKVLLGASFAAISALILMALRKKNGSAMDLIAAALAGAVALTAFAPYISNASAALSGMFAGTVTIGVRRMLVALELDDPGDLIASFLSGGLIGGLLAPVLWLGSGYTLLDQIVIQLLGIVAISFWSFGIPFLTAKLLSRVVTLRVSESDEVRGLSRVHFGVQSEPDFVVTQLLRGVGQKYVAVQTGDDQISKLANDFSQSVAQLRNETHRASERVLTTVIDIKHGAAMTARIRLAESNLKVKAEDILLALGSALNSQSLTTNGVGYNDWMESVLQILLEPTIREIAQFSRHLPLQAELDELENIILAATDAVERSAHFVDLLRDLSDAQRLGFFSRDHTCDLAALLDKQSLLLSALADVRNSPIQIDCPVEAGLTAAGDANAFTRIMTLSVEGALARLLGKHGKPVRVELREHASGHHIVFECLDTGSALSSRQIRAIMDPVSENHVLDELGLPQILPLMLVARLVEAIGGEFSLHSEHGLGTLLHCRFRKVNTQSKSSRIKAA